MPSSSLMDPVTAAHCVALSPFLSLAATIRAEQVRLYRTAGGEVGEFPPYDAEPTEYPRPMGVTPVEG